MSEHDDAQDAMARLQSALARIAARASAPQGVPAEAPPDPRLGEVAARLDAVIAQLREALGDG